MQLKQLYYNLVELSFINSKNKRIQVCFSYESPVAAKFDGKIYIFPAYNHSRTTSKHLKNYLGYSSKEIQEDMQKNGDNSQFIFCTTPESILASCL